MPTYNYICKSCNHDWEQAQSIKEDAIKTCPKCEKDEAKRVISKGTNFSLKGEGWYADGYSKGTKTN